MTAPNGRSWRNLDLQEFTDFYLSHTNPEVAVYYGVNIRTVREWANRVGLSKGYLSSGPAIAFPTNAGDPYNDAISLSLERCIIIGDCETPDHDIASLEMVVSIGKKFGIKTLLINGDFVAYDSFSPWAMAQARKVFFKQEMDAAAIALRVFLQTFERIYWDEGNHERRLAHKTDGQIAAGDFLKEFAGDVEFSQYDHLDLQSGGREIYVTHQKNYGDVPLSVPTKLAVKLHKCIWCGHNHRLAYGYDPSGKFWIVEGGHCRSEIHTHYKQLRTTTHRAWNQGFGFVIDGEAYLVDKQRFSFWMSIQPPQIGVEMKKISKRRKRNANR